jgi:23S rRNA pseudouridine2605 synthase
MRLNKFIAQATGMSRRTADTIIAADRIRVNGHAPSSGQQITEADTVKFDNKPLKINFDFTTIVLNKPVGYVVSRNGQGSKTVYDLLPPAYQPLKPIGRLDKDSSGLLLLTNDGALANELTHPSRQKIKRYAITLNKSLAPLHRQMISDHGLQLDDGVSQLYLERTQEGNDILWQVTMHEGRNRQIRRTFAALGYEVKHLHRTHFGDYQLSDLPVGSSRKL